MADIEILMPMIKQFMPFAQKRMGFEDPPRLFLKGDAKNAKNPLGKTAFYDPENKSVTIYTTNRHPKDIMRSLSHELVHHTQNCRGEFDKTHEMGDGYAQNDSHMREMEREAYEVGNMCFRDWEDGIKQTIYFEHLQKGDNKMSTKDWKNGEIKSLLSENWGFKMDLSKLNEAKGEKGDADPLDGERAKFDKDHDGVPDGADKDKDDPDVGAKNEGAFDANHYCVHHGGVHHEGKIRMAEAIQHVKPDENGHISHYDMKLEDGTVLENVAVEDIQVTEASLAEKHGKRDHKKMKDDEELDEQSKSDLPDRGAGRAQGGRRLDEEDEDAPEDKEDNESDLKRARDAAKRPGRSALDRQRARRNRGGGIKGLTKEEFPGKSDMDTHKRDLSEERLKEIIAHALKTRG